MNESLGQLCDSSNCEKESLKMSEQVSNNNKQITFMKRGKTHKTHFQVVEF